MGTESYIYIVKKRKDSLSFYKDLMKCFDLGFVPDFEDSAISEWSNYGRLCKTMNLIFKEKMNKLNLELEKEFGKEKVTRYTKYDINIYFPLYLESEDLKKALDIFKNLSCDKEDNYKYEYYYNYTVQIFKKLISALSDDLSDDAFIYIHC